MTPNPAATTLGFPSGAATDVDAGWGARGRLVDWLMARDPRPTRVLVLHDPAVEGLAQGIAREIALPVSVLKLPKGEQAKRLMTIEQLHAAVSKITPTPDRGCLVVAVGGGAAGDTAGFFAASLLRGVSVVQVPTTLLAMVDSSLGGKTGLNTLLGKNMVGAFHQPEAVFADPTALATLPEREFRAALSEIVKLGVVLDGGLFERLEKNAGVLAGLCRMEARQDWAKADWQPDPSAELLLAVIRECLRLKGNVATADEREAGLRRVLNFGHTIGHALESIGQYRELLHGEAVALGMRAALRLGLSMGVTPAADVERVVGLMDRLGLPAEWPRWADPGQVVEAAWGDKKRLGGKLRVVLCAGIGRYEIREVGSPAELRGAVGW